MLEAVEDGELPSDEDAAGRVADKTAPTASAALKANEAKCFKVVLLYSVASLS